VREELRHAVDGSTWELWFAPLRGRAYDGATLIVEAPDEIRGWVAERYGRLLDGCAAATLGPGVRVEIVGPDAGAERARAAGGKGGRGVGRRPAAPTPHAPADAPREAAPASGTGFNPKFTFDQFVIGQSNRMAHAAALAVAELPGLAYNPLFICGPPGLGKTHLLHSIGNYVAEYGDAPVRYTTAENFTNHFVAALQGRGFDAFKARYRDVGILLVDDVQFLQAKARTEEEFFHTFNALHEAGAQIVLTSDRLPRDMDAMEDRLRERFEAGLVCDVLAPDAVTRLAILRKRVQQDGIEGVDPAALDLIAARVTDHVRALEGALIRVVAYGSLTGKPVTAQLANEVLGTLYPAATSQHAGVTVTVSQVQERVAAAFGLSVETLLSQSRAGHVSWPRQLAMYLARELTGETLPAIGKAFGGRNHTTVLYAHRRTAERMAGDPEAYEAVRRLTEALRGQAA
jgi:chromosomal replication initiator protein